MTLWVIKVIKPSELVIQGIRRYTFNCDQMKSTGAKAFPRPSRLALKRYSSCAWHFPVGQLHEMVTSCVDAHFNLSRTCTEKCVILTQPLSTSDEENQLASAQCLACAASARSVCRSGVGWGDEESDLIRANNKNTLLVPAGTLSVRIQMDLMWVRIIHCPALALIIFFAHS